MLSVLPARRRRHAKIAFRTHPSSTMKVFGLTGGVGMGKSTAAKFLVELGIAMIDTDIIAREVVQPGREALQEIKMRFGNEIIGSDGQLRRDELARRVF